MSLFGNVQPWVFQESPKFTFTLGTTYSRSIIPNTHELEHVRMGQIFTLFDDDG